MGRGCRIGGFFLCCLVLTGLSALAFSVEDVLQDGEYLWEMLEQVHPNLYHTTPREGVEEFFYQFQDQVSEGEEYTLWEAFSLLAPLAALFQDGHTRVFFPSQEWETYLAEGGLAFPFLLQWLGEEITIQDPSGEEDFVPGTLLLSINGVEAREIRERMLQVLSFERRAYAAHVFGDSFQQLLWGLFQLESPFNIEYYCLEEGEGVLVHPGLPLEDLPGKKQTLPFQRSYLTSHTALLVMDSVPPDLEEAFFWFLQDSFAQFQRRGIENLIIDMRNNRGGGAPKFHELYYYISDTPYRPYSRIHVRYSPPYLEGLPWYQRVYYRLRLFFQEGNIISLEPEEIIPGENPHRFQGPVYLVVGPGTFSGAVNFAAVCQDHQAALIVGEETGGLPSGYGGSFTFNLPQTGLTARSSCKYFLRCSGEDTGQGVIPHLEMGISGDYGEILELIDS